MTVASKAIGKQLAKDETFCLAVWDTLRTIEYREEQLRKERALLAEVERRKKLSPFRRFLEHTWREF